MLENYSENRHTHFKTRRVRTVCSELIRSGESQEIGHMFFHLKRTYESILMH